jgi:hypothetical protein
MLTPSLCAVFCSILTLRDSMLFSRFSPHLHLAVCVVLPTLKSQLLPSCPPLSHRCQKRPATGLAAHSVPLTSSHCSHRLTDSHRLMCLFCSTVSLSLESLSVIPQSLSLRLTALTDSQTHRLTSTHTSILFHCQPVANHHQSFLLSPFSLPHAHPLSFSVAAAENNLPQPASLAAHLALSRCTHVNLQGHMSL